MAEMDFNSPTWRALSEHLAREQAKLLDRLANPSVDFPTTQHLRGQIEALRRIAALSTPDEPLPVIQTGARFGIS
jgi:hypothetical protein